MSIKKVDKDRFEKIADSKEPRGLFYTRVTETGRYRAINTRKKHEALDFQTLDEAKAYLNNEAHEKTIAVMQRLATLKKNEVQEIG